MVIGADGPTRSDTGNVDRDARLAHDGPAVDGDRPRDSPSTDAAAPRWVLVDGGIQEELRGVAAFGKQIVVVGRRGTAIRFDGVRWRALSPLTGFDLWDVWGTGVSNFFVVGGATTGDSSQAGTQWRYSGGEWITFASDGITKTRTGVWGSGGVNVIAVGPELGFHAAMHYNGLKWSVMWAFPQALRAIWGSGSADVFAVGNAGSLFHHDGNALGTWTSMASGTTQTLLAVGGTATDNVYAAGDQGTLLHYDGRQWTSVQSNTSETLYGIATANPNDAVIVGSSGLVLRYNGVDWQPDSSPTSRDLYAVAHGTDGYVAVGAMGTIVHRATP